MSANATLSTTLSTNSAFPGIFNHSADATLPLPPNVPIWSWYPILTLVIQICAFFTNGSLAYLFIRSPTLVSPFTIYIINLSIANVLCSIFYDSIDLVSNLYPGWWLGDHWCTFYQYCDWIITGSMCNCHVLIALNRFWAVTFPTSYRLRHKKKFAICVCLAMWVYMHVCLLPGILLDAIVYRPTVTEVTGCNVGTNAPRAWQITMQFLIFVGPIVVIGTLLPVICYKVLKRSRRKIASGNLSSTGRRNTGVSDKRHTGPSAEKAAGTDTRRNTTVSGRMTNDHQNRREKYSRGILALVLMSTTVLVLYTPVDLYFTLRLVFEIKIDGLDNVGQAMYVFMPVLDPIWFIITLKDLRHAFFRTFCF